MKNIHLVVFEELKKQLLNFPRNTFYDHCLRIIVDAQLNKLKYSDEGFEPEKLSRQVIYAKARGVNENTVSSEIAKNKIKTDRLNVELIRFIESQPDCEQAFNAIGYLPEVISSVSEGGAKNRTLVWMSIKAIENEEVCEKEQIAKSAVFDSDENIENDEDLSNITYERKAASEIKPSLFTRLFFKKGELKILSFRGVLLMVLLMLSFLVDIFIAIFSLLVILLISELPNFKLWQAILFVAFIPLAYLNWRYFFMPLYRLPYYRVIKAPMFFANINVVNADIEMYWDKDRLNVARVTEFTATCPICSGLIELADGKPDQKQPLVGRCKEAPHAHVYSFDRMSMKGYFLGVSDYLIIKN
ncbi:hypothetical protein BTW00_08500 [Psychrobacter sp. C 20.9]|uniref:hypothetical protein n=1 Tax=Psychrobacter sp. C 20.9 TaxID=1926477 RepID=UPI000946ACF2|nr:hypothetical protein [Psychrobacter sp. C 20.9]OLF35565.1 hypothetical protein BTW00_08500 [Psychrobacter sp. C 20.9]